MTKSERRRWCTATCEEYRRGSESQRAFCRARGLSVSSLQYWLRKRRSEATKTESTAPVEVATVSAQAPTTKMLRVRGPGEVTVELERPVDREELAPHSSSHATREAYSSGERKPKRFRGRVFNLCSIIAISSSGINA